MKYFITLLILIGVYAAVKFLMECAKDLNVNADIKQSETTIIDAPVKEPECWQPPLKKDPEIVHDDTHKRVA